MNKRTVTVSAKFEGVVPTAPFSNFRPGFSAEETFEIDAPSAERDLVISIRQRELHNICYEQFQNVAELARIEKIKTDLKNFRFYTKDGENYPSVTSIINYDKEFFVTDEELKQYAAQGTIIDWEVRNYVETGKWVESKDEPSLAAERWIIKSGKLGLSLSGWNFLGFLEKYPIKNLRSHKDPLHNDQFRYAGTPDLEGEYLGLPTLVSLKRTKDETQNFIQESAYAKCLGMEHIKQMMIVELKPEADGGNKQGFSKPSVSTDIDRYFELFKHKRNEFKKVYGI